MSAGRTYWLALDARWLAREGVVEAGDRFGPVGPVLLLAVYELAFEQGDTGRVITGRRSLAHRAFASSEDVVPVLRHYAECGLLTPLATTAPDERHLGDLTLEVVGWREDQDEGRAAIRAERGARPYTPPTLRLAVLERDHYACRACGARAGASDGKRMPEGFELDHAYPYSRGGAHTLENLQLLCTPCNRSKGARV